VYAPDMFSTPIKTPIGKKQHQAGLSVLEALVAIALISVAFLPLLSLQAQQFSPGSLCR